MNFMTLLNILNLVCLIDHPHPPSLLHLTLHGGYFHDPWPHEGFKRLNNGLAASLLLPADAAEYGAKTNG